VEYEAWDVRCLASSLHGSRLVEQAAARRAAPERHKALNMAITITTSGPEVGA
jgi:hypothetical protein